MAATEPILVDDVDVELLEALARQLRVNELDRESVRPAEPVRRRGGGVRTKSASVRVLSGRRG